MIKFLVKYRKHKVFFILLKLLGIELPADVIGGENIIFPHLGGNIVIHPNCIIGNNVMIFQGVTIGRANPWEKESEMGKIHIGSNACICSGAVIICSTENIYIGENSVIAANAVLNQSVQSNEIWGGIPAHKLRNL